MKVEVPCMDRARRTAPSADVLSFFGHIALLKKRRQASHTLHEAKGGIFHLTRWLGSPRHRVEKCFIMSPDIILSCLPRAPILNHCGVSYLTVVTLLRRSSFVPLLTRFALLSTRASMLQPPRTGTLPRSSIARCSSPMHLCLPRHHTPPSSCHG